MAQTFVFVGNTEVGKRVSSSLIAGGFLAAPTLGEADVVFTFAESQSMLEDIYFDTPGLLQDTKEGAILVDLSATTPTFARELNAVAQVNDRMSIDAPLVVRNVAEEDAFAFENLLLLVGAEGSAYDEVAPMLESIASRVELMGVTGVGQASKIALTMQSAGSFAGLVEGFASLRALKVPVDAEDLLDIAESCGYLSPVQAAFMESVFNEDYRGSYTVGMFMGELSAALSSADEEEISFPLCDSAFRLYELLAVVGGVDYNPAALNLVFSDEDAAKRFELDWERAEGAYDDGCDCGCGHDHDHDHECECGHDSNDPDHECCGKHHHHH